MKIRSLIASALRSVILLALLSGCSFARSVLGVDPALIDTTNKGLAVVAVEIAATADLTKTLLEADAITPAQAAKARDVLQDALDGVKAAQAQIAESGDPILANSALNKAQSAVELVRALIIGRPQSSLRIGKGNRHADRYYDYHQRLFGVDALA